MKLKCRINDFDCSDYLVEGASFTDNLNETLDSGTIVLDQIPEIKGLKPYDDVYIWDSSEEFEGYYNKGDSVDLTSHFSSNVTDFRRSITDLFVNFEISNLDNFSDKESLVYEGVNDTNFLVFSGTFVDLLINTLVIDTNNRFNVFNKVINFKFERMASVSGFYRPFSLVYEDYQGNRNYFLEDSVNNLKWNCYFNEKEGKMYVDSGNKLNYVIGGEIMLPIWSKTSLTTLPSEKYFVKINKSIQKIIVLSVDDLMINNVFEGGVISFKYKGAWVDRYIYNLSRNGQEVVITFGKNITQTETLTFVNGECVFSDNEYSESNWKSFVDDIKIKKWQCTMKQNSVLPNKFFKHMLVDSYSRNRLNLGNSYKDEKVIFRYTINLFSEVKKLEKIILPNTTITQSLVQKEKRTCWDYLNNFLQLYSPKIKMVDDTYRKTWKYVQKYKISDSKNEYLENGKTQYITNLKEVFENTICPELSWTSPSLRDVLNQIFSIKDLIPVVFNDVVYGLNIGAEDEDLPIFDRSNDCVSFDVSSMSSSDYATDARREYGGALSQENSAHMVEFMGFRSPGSAFLNLESMQLETRFPIYKINTIKLCFYRRYHLVHRITGQSTTKTFMCKYDISPLVLQNSVRNSMSINYEKFEDEVGDIINNTDTLEENLARISTYKLCTVGYDIGSNVITGWGAQYEYLNFLWFKDGKTYIENILRLLSKATHAGTEVYMSELKDFDNDYIVSFPSEELVGDHNIFADIIVLGDESNDNFISKLKSIVFEIDYDAMYSGAVVHGKDYIDDDDITTVDNCSTSLAVLETDGLFEKEKLNRMSNTQFKFTARYDNDNGGALYSRVQQIGTLDKGYTNATVYSREYQIYDNCILANYSASYNYILKNYFTSVWAKYRTYSYMSYGESVKRTENRRQLILLSTDKQYYEDEDLTFKNPNLFSNFFSFFLPTEKDNYRFLPNVEKINCGYFEIKGKKYLSDINSFATGNSVCFNLSTYGNLSGGEYLESLSSDYNVGESFLLNFPGEKREDVIKDYKSLQNWYNITDSLSDAFVEKVGVYICHLDTQNAYENKILTEGETLDDLGKRLMKLPLLDNELVRYCSNFIGNDFTLYKDNKEKLDFTFQFDYLSSEKDNILFSPWVAKLNDLVGMYKKTEGASRFIYDTATNASLLFYLYEDPGYMESSIEPGYPIDDFYSTGKKTIVLKITKQSWNSGEIQRRIATEGSMDLDECEFIDNKPFTTLIEDDLHHARYVQIQPNYKISISRVLEAVEENTDDIKVRGVKVDLTYAFKGQVITYDENKFIEEDEDNISKTTIIDTKLINEEKHLELTLANTDMISGLEDEYYYYFVARLSVEELEMFETTKPGTSGQNPTRIHFIPEYTKTGPSREITDVDETNSLYQLSLGFLTDPIYKHFPGNMCLIKSKKKVENHLVYNSFFIDENNHCELPDYMEFDTKGINGLEEGHNVQDIFNLVNKNLTGPSIVVKGSVYQDKDINSIQYYYKDDNGYLHFVFGVNLEKDEEGNNKDMRIYLSCISKRSMKVYDNNHNVIGYAANYADSDNEFVYGTGQFYKEI